MNYTLFIITRIPKRVHFILSRNFGNTIQPFGVGGVYRYGFNGKENDNEIKGEGNQIDYGMRIYDPRVARFLSVDPLTPKYPMLTPYQFASNRPIDGIDEDGLEYSPAGKNTGGVPRDNTAVTTVSEHPTVTDDNKTNAGYYDRLRTMSKSSIGKPAGASSTPVRINYDQKIHDANVAAAYSEAGYDKDGNRVGVYKLLENKSFNKLSENMLIPMAEMAVGEGAGKLVTATFVPKFTVDPKKFDYFFGRVVTGSEHNVVRSAQNFRDLTTLGITTDRQLMRYFGEALRSGEVQSVKSNAYGTAVTTSIDVNKRGLINVTFFYEGGNLNAVPKITTLIPKIYKTP